MSGIGPKRPRTYDNIEAPIGYEPGKGRGATGFVTRFDIGPAVQSDQGGTNEDITFDESGDNNIGIDTENNEYDAEDAEAEAIFDAIDKSMMNRKNKKKSTDSENNTNSPFLNTDIRSVLVDKKRPLEKMTEEEWYSIEDIGDKSLKWRQSKKKESFTPAPDSLLEARRMQNALSPYIVDPSGYTSTSGTETSTNYSSARQQLLGQTLEKKGDSLTGQTVVDPKGYMTSLNDMKINTEAEIGDIKKARTIFASLVKADPTNEQGWISYARLEEAAGKVAQARKIIRKGCESCPKSEEIWLESARLQTPENAKIVLIDAVKRLPTSVQIWLHAAELETDINKKKRVLWKAIEFIPNSVLLWRTAIELEPPESALILLQRAVENVPESIELWLALAKLETYENARKVLNQARKALPTEPTIWFTAAQLEETNGSIHRINTIIERAVKSLQTNNVVINRNDWIKQAENMEKAGARETCSCIIKNVLDIGVEKQDRSRTWLADASNCVNNGSIETARAIYAYTLGVFPDREDIWLKSTELEEKYGTPSSTASLLKTAVSHCPHSELLWLMSAKLQYRKLHDIDMARKVLEEAILINNSNKEFVSSERIWLAAMQIEYENNNFDRARDILAKSRASCKSPRVWMKSALLEWELNNYQEEETILLEAKDKYPSYDKLWMMLGQLKEEKEQFSEARKFYRDGLQRCQQSTPLWLLYVRLEKRITSVAKARSLLEIARIKNPKSTEIWLESIQLEREQGNNSLVTQLLSKALQENPSSGRLIVEDILNAPKPQQKTLITKALSQYSEDPYIIMLAARRFWSSGLVEKTRLWMDRSLAINSDIGDHWAIYYIFELEYGTEEDQNKLLQRFEDAHPTHGDIWCSISKLKENRRKPLKTILILTMTKIKAQLKK
ncbi:hypothetical protein WA158_004953 [Blastocystis sp. Blastoise]